jgi:hypothetical protein
MSNAGPEGPEIFTIVLVKGMTPELLESIALTHAADCARPRTIRSMPTVH